MRASHPAIALLTAAALALPGAAFAEEEEEKKKDESSETSTTSSSSGSSAFKQKGALLDASPQERHQMLSFFAFIPWNWGIGIGGAVRYNLPIVPQGFIPALNDSFELEFGADIWAGWWGYGYASYSYVGLAAPIGEARWAFHLTDKWEVYGKVGLGWSFAFGSWGGGSIVGPGGFYWSAAPGAIYHFSDSMTLRAEFGNQGARVGLGINL